MKERRTPEYLENTPLGELQKMSNAKAQNSSPSRDSNPHSSIGDRLGKQTS